MTQQPPAELLRITTHHGDHRVVRLIVTGEVDLATAGQLRTALLASLAAVEGPDSIEVDLSGTTFIDATGVRVLLEVSQAATRAQSRLVIRDPHVAVVRVLGAAGVADTLGVVARPAAPL